MTGIAYIGADIFDGSTLHAGKALLVDEGISCGIVEAGAVPQGLDAQMLEGGVVTPGFVDLQVNGGGGVMFNEETSVEGIRTIATAHAATGTMGFLATLITDYEDRTRMAVDAVEAAISQGVQGVLGLHLEGPHLSTSRNGAHDATLIRQLEASDEAFLINAAERLPNLLVTLAPESVRMDQITRLSEAGVIISLGHSECSYATARAAFAAGARCATHLFNAMSPLASRAPGLVGAVLDDGAAFAGLIADGIHVDPATIRIALRGKRGPGQIFLVTDSMSSVGSDIQEFTLNGRQILRRGGELTLADGTLAGADLVMPKAISVMIKKVGLSTSEALKMATSVPAGLLRKDFGHGHISTGQPMSAVHLMSTPNGLTFNQRLV